MDQGTSEGCSQVAKAPAAGRWVVDAAFLLFKQLQTNVAAIVAQLLVHESRSIALQPSAMRAATSALESGMCCIQALGA